MTYVVVQNCCNDASCVQVCPVDCIRPTPGDPNFLTAEMLYINPAECIDCGACQEACPVDAIKPDFEIPDHLSDYIRVNADYFSLLEVSEPPQIDLAKPKAHHQEGPLRVAVVGAGPSGWYVADELVNSDRATVEVTVIDKLPVSHGLVRHGVAPDHQATKRIGATFDRTSRHRRVALRLGVEVGKDISHDELAERFDAVVYCTGAAKGRELGIPGEKLPGVVTSADFVHWYNGHPEQADLAVPLGGKRAVVIGNGNVALDIARVLLLPRERLAVTDIAEHALEALRGSAIEEVVVLGRRGARHAAFTSPELRSILAVEGVDVLVEGDSLADAPEVDSAAAYAAAQKLTLLREAVATPGAEPAEKTLVLRFNATPTEILGGVGAEGVVLTQDGGASREVLAANLIITAIGFASARLPGVPFNRSLSRFAQMEGRILDDDGEPVTGLYTAGWVKRGPNGVIGTNRQCAVETVGALLDDYVAHRLRPPSPEVVSLDALLEERGVRALDADQWRALDAEERERGRAVGRPRVKIASLAEAQRALVASAAL